MKNIASFIVKRKLLILGFMVLLTAVFGLLIPRVNINTDMTKYLSEGSFMKMGLGIMEEEFPDTKAAFTIRVMFENLTDEQKKEVLGELKEIPYVDTVDYQTGGEEYNKGSFTLFILHTSYDYETKEEASIETYLEENFDEYHIAYKNDDEVSADIPLIVVVLALVILVIILLIMCGSFAEPFLFLITIGMAILLNLGSNVLLGEISNITAGIAAILQLVLSMDYSIILMNRYRQELENREDSKEAMTAAITGAFSSIISSSFTTMAGLLALVFLNFKIGMDLGIVLAKGVLCSMLCVLLILPALILIFDKLIRKTEKKKSVSGKRWKKPIGAMSTFGFKFRKVIVAVFLFLFVGSCLLQAKTRISYRMTDKDSVAQVFQPANTIIMVYENKDDEAAAALAQSLEEDEAVKSAVSFSQTLGKQYTSAELADVASHMGSDMKLTEEMLNIIYYDYFKDGELLPVTVSDFIHFIAEEVAPNDTFGEYLDGSVTKNMDTMLKFADKEALITPMTAEQTADFFDLETWETKQFFLYYYIKKGGADTGTMTLPVFADFLVNEAAENENYAGMLGKGALEQIESLRSFTDTGQITAPGSYEDIAKLLGMEENVARLLFSYYYAQSEAYKPAPMTVQEFVRFIREDVAQDKLLASNLDEASLARIDVLARFSEKTTVQMQLTSAQLAEAFEMDEALVKQLFAVSFGSQEARTGTMTLSEFTGFLVQNVLANAPENAAYFDDATKARIISLNQLMQAAASGKQQSSAELAGCLGLDETMVQQLLLLYSGGSGAVTTMTLQDFTSFLVEQVMQDTAYAPLFDDALKAQLQEMQGLISAAAAGHAFPAAQLAGLINIEESLALQIYTLYFGSNTEGKTMSMEQFVDDLFSHVVQEEAFAGYFDENTVMQLGFIQSIMKAGIEETHYSHEEMARLLGMDNNVAKMLYTFHDSFGDTGAWRLSLQTVVNFLADNKKEFGGMLGETEQRQLEMAQKLINGSVSGRHYAASELAGLVGIEESQAEQLYLLYTSLHGDTGSWKITAQDFAGFLMDDVLSDKELAERFDEESTASLRTGRALMDAVVSQKTYTAGEMMVLLAGVSKELNEDTMELLYLYYASRKEARPEWRMSVSTLFSHLADDMVSDSRFRKLFDDRRKQEVQDIKTELDEAAKQLKGKNHSLLILTTSLPGEAPQTSEFIRSLMERSDSRLEGDYYLVGSSVMNYEMENSFTGELLLITLLTAAAVFLVVAVAFRSLVISAVLVLLVQCGVYITVSVVGIQGYSINYLALLIVQSILMGATIDYGILFTNYYRQSRKSKDAAEALTKAYQGSIHTVLTSALIMILITAVAGRFFENPTVAQICTTLSIGVLSAGLLILFILPGLLAALVKSPKARKRFQRAAGYDTINKNFRLWLTRKGPEQRNK